MARLTLLPNLPTDLRKLHGSCYTKPASLVDVMFDQLEWLIGHASGKSQTNAVTLDNSAQVRTGGSKDLLPPLHLVLGGTTIRVTQPGSTGEFSAGGYSTAQQGTMPTFELLGTARAHLLDLERGAWLGSAIARAFDGETWKTTLIAETGAWYRRGSTVVTAVAKPQQLSNGDLLSDEEATLGWTNRGISYDATAGARLGWAQARKVAWLSLSATFLFRHQFLVTGSIGNFPADLRQALPGVTLTYAPNPPSTAHPGRWRAARRGRGARADRAAAKRGRCVVRYAGFDIGRSVRPCPGAGRATGRDHRRFHRLAAGHVGSRTDERVGDDASHSARDASVQHPTRRPGVDRPIQRGACGR